MSEKRILIASLLKPVNDTRMYEKLAVSLSKLPGAMVHLCGYSAPFPERAATNIIFHPLFSFRRLSMARFTAQVKYYNLLKSVKPDLIIASTHELLLTSYIYCKKYKVKLVYDVQENYALNLRMQHNYNSVLKRLFAFGVERTESFIAPRIAHFILAERSYAHELNFLNGRYTILENKYKKPLKYTLPHTPVLLRKQPLRLLYSGTIAKEYGILEAIALADKLHEIDTDTTFTIIGYCANSDTWEQVVQQTEGKAYLKVVGGSKLVPHSEIIKEMQHCNVGLLPYHPNESINSCIPTKLYEYMANALIILIPENPTWKAIVQQHQAGIAIDFKSINAALLHELLQQQLFYTLGIADDIFWEQEEQYLLNLVQRLTTE
ncbi:glycosyltransferase [Pontibacter sp. H249]|uniref:glycosyltransferase n=1 Tax=Pontibacter sp. H249 TaxID=3133420 RepID=UPI0030BB1960